MAVNFATPIAHQTGADYAAFNNAIAVGRPYRQPLQSATDSANFSRGLEFFLSSANDVAVIYSWLDGALTWQASSTLEPGHRLILTTDPRTLTGTDSLASLSIVEAPPKKTIYENVDQGTVQTALESLLNHSYAAAVAAPADRDNWHSVMRMAVSGAGIRMKKYLDDNPPAATTITNLVTAFLAGGAGIVVDKIMVEAEDAIGHAAPYLAADPLPAAPPFALGGPADANRARRLTFQVSDINGQPINPAYYLHIFMRRMLLPAAGRIVTSLTNIVAGGILAHPLVSAFPALSAAAVPRAREQVTGISRFPLGALNTLHRYPSDTPISKLQWRYTDGSVFEAQAFEPGTVVPSMAASGTNRVTNLWTAHGATIGAIAEALQIPLEVIFGLIGAEAGLVAGNPNQFDERSVRLEPLNAPSRKALHKAGVAAALELGYDHVVGIQGNVTNVVRNADETTRLDITLTSKKKWAENFLSTNITRDVLVADTDRLRVTANSANSDPNGTTDYQITVKDFQFKGGFAKAGTQGAGSTLYYSPSNLGAGHASEPPARETTARSGTLRRLQVQSETNNLNNSATITVFRNGVATGLTVTLAAGTKDGSDNVNVVTAAAGDNISVQVAATGTTGQIKNLTFSFQNAPTTGDAWVLDGYPTSVPDPWTGGSDVKSGLTWDQLVEIVNGTHGARISPGIMQTLITTANDEVLPWLKALQPDVFTATGIPAPPATAGGFLNDWLLHAPHSILVGAAKIRKGNNRHATRFDLPVVGSAYNRGSPKQSRSSPWGLVYFGKYVESAGPISNAAANLFNKPSTVPAPTVRFML